MSEAPGWRPGLRWYVVRTHAREEARAECSLAGGGISTFLPRIEVARRAAVRGAAAEPLFPQYLFARFDAEERLRDVSFARGVQQVVRVGGSLASIEDDAIAMLQARVGPDGYVRLGAEVRPGDRVVISAGPFASLGGVVERQLPAKSRVAILLSSVAHGLRVEVPWTCVRRSWMSCAAEA